MSSVAHIRGIHCIGIGSTLLCICTGIDFKIRTIELGDKKIKLQIW
jgi:hypothetical protein